MPGCKRSGSRLRGRLWCPRNSTKPLRSACSVIVKILWRLLSEIVARHAQVSSCRGTETVLSKSRWVFTTDSVTDLWHLHCNFDSAPRLTGDSVVLPFFRSSSVLALVAVISIPAVTAAQHQGNPGGHPGPPAQSVVVGASYGYPGFWYGWGGWGAPYGQWAPYGPVPYGPYYPYPYVVDPFSATVKFTVLPKDAEVYVDGALAGKIDDFDGRFQSL